MNVTQSDNSPNSKTHITHILIQHNPIHNTYIDMIGTYHTDPSNSYTPPCGHTCRVTVPFIQTHTHI